MGWDCSFLRQRLALSQVEVEGVPVSGGPSKVMGTFSLALISNLCSARPTELPVSGKPGFGRSHERFLLTPGQMGIVSPYKDDPEPKVV